MESTRQKKYARLIQKELGEIFQQDVKNLFGHVFITVTRVSMSPDLGVAKVHLSFMLSKNPDEIMQLVLQKKNEIRKILGNRIRNQVRVIPELIFYNDMGAEYSSRIDDILSNLDIPPEKESDEMP